MADTSHSPQPRDPNRLSDGEVARRKEAFARRVREVRDQELAPAKGADALAEIAATLTDIRDSLRDIATTLTALTATRLATARQPDAVLRRDHAQGS